MQVKGKPAGRSAEPGEDWRTAGSCLTADPDLFFGPEGETQKQRPVREEAARAICQGCPVARQCLESALRFGSTFGVWGGLGETERLQLKTVPA